MVVAYDAATWCTFQPNLEKIKMVCPEKIFIFWEMELSSSKIKKFIIFPYISGNRTLHSSSPKPKKQKFLILKQKALVDFWTDS